MEQKKRKVIPLGNLTLLDRFLFDEIMENEEIHNTVLEILLGRELALLDKVETEKELRTSPELRAVRMDVYAMDQDGVVYNSEMQKQRKYDLPKRSRYYQGLLDSSLLEPGVVTFSLLNDSYIIVITPYDVFGLKKYRYIFRARCDEDLNCILPDGAVRIFFNTKGKNHGEVDEELIHFLRYVEKTDEETALKSGSEKIWKIHEYVCKIKASEKVGVKYMQKWEEIVYERMEARAEGIKEGIKEGRRKGRKEGMAEGKAEGQNRVNELNRKLEEDGRMEDILRSFKDKEFQSRLFEEYGL